MTHKIGLALIAVALCAPALGCTKNKKRAAKLEAELQRCRAAVQKLESGELTKEEAGQYAAVTCGSCEDGGAQ